MKRLSFLAVAITISMASFAQVKPAEKKLQAALTISQWDYHFNNLSGIAGIIDKSNLPHDQVKAVLSAIDSLRKDIIPQLQHELADSTAKKGKP